MYVAIQSFKASNGVTYRMGDIIDDKTYANLSAKDKAKCKLRKEEVSQSVVEDYENDWE